MCTAVRTSRPSSRRVSADVRPEASQAPIPGTTLGTPVSTSHCCAESVPRPPWQRSSCGPPRSWSGPRPPSELVVSTAAHEKILAAASAQLVVAGLAPHLVVAPVAVEDVATRAAEGDVEAAPGGHDVRTWSADQPVVARAAAQDVVAAAAGQLGSTVRRAEHVVSVARHDGRRRRAGDDDVVARCAGEDDVAGPADDRGDGARAGRRGRGRQRRGVDADGQRLLDAARVVGCGDGEARDAGRRRGPRQRRRAVTLVGEGQAWR